MTRRLHGGRLPAREAAQERAADALGGAVDSNIEIALHVFDHQGRRILETHFDAAALIDAAARPIEIRKPNDHPRDIIFRMAQGES